VDLDWNQFLEKLEVFGQSMKQILILVALLSLILGVIEMRKRPRKEM